jgi:hypothetical protein
MEGKRPGSWVRFPSCMSPRDASLGGGYVRGCRNYTCCTDFDALRHWSAAVCVYIYTCMYGWGDHRYVGYIFSAGFDYCCLPVLWGLIKSSIASSNLHLRQASGYWCWLAASTVSDTDHECSPYEYGPRPDHDNKSTSHMITCCSVSEPGPSEPRDTKI